MFAPHNRSAGLAAATAAVATFTLIILRQRQQRNLKGLANDASYNGYTELRPPFPSEIIALFEVASLCYLSTTIENAPHISLMNFTYDRESELLVFTTRRDTQKVFRSSVRNSHENSFSRIHGFLLACAHKAMFYFFIVFDRMPVLPLNGEHLPATPAHCTVLKLGSQSPGRHFTPRLSSPQGKYTAVKMYACSDKKNGPCI